MILQCPDTAGSEVLQHLRKTYLKNGKQHGNLWWLPLLWAQEEQTQNSPCNNTTSFTSPVLVTFRNNAKTYQEVLWVKLWLENQCKDNFHVPPSPYSSLHFKKSPAKRPSLFAVYFKKLAPGPRSNYAFVRKYIVFLLCKNNSSAEELARQASLYRATHFQL